MLTYPRTRMRRNRKCHWSRELFAETHLMPSDFIIPLFVIEGINKTESIDVMPDILRYTVDRLVDKVKSLHDMGIQAIMLFPHIEHKLKDPLGSEALNRSNLMSRAIKEIKKHVPQIGVIADVALDPYTSHGHDGVLGFDNDVDNDETVKILTQQALILADSGADAVAPSDMMDGRVGVIRDELESNGYKNTQIFSYSVKFNSGLYRPFRYCIGSQNSLGNSDKKTYFIDPRNGNEAMKEISLDISEGADAIIIKPGMCYLDIISKSKKKFPEIPLFVYQVSGEYSLLKNGHKTGIIDETDVVIEIMHSFKRAGAQSIITYYGDQLLKWISFNTYG